jgi:DNA helicase HerA-like ATPase
MARHDFHRKSVGHHYGRSATADSARTIVSTLLVLSSQSSRNRCVIVRNPRGYFCAYFSSTLQAVIYSRRSVDAAKVLSPAVTSTLGSRVTLRNQSECSAYAVSK